MRYEYTDGRNPDFLILCSELDVFLNELVGGEKNRAVYIPLNALDDIHDVVVAYDGELPVGCGSFKQYDSTTAEVKRVFVCSAYRGRGISRKIMMRLENKAREKGFNKLILETGEPLSTAMGLYKNVGYRVIPNYGEYKSMPQSICMEKLL